MHVPLRIREVLVLAVVGVMGLAASGTHVIESGETLSSIASAHGTTVSRLVEANGLRNPNLIVVGQTLKIPGGGKSASAAPSRRTHIVRRGDTLASIARRYGTTVAELVSANDLDDPNRIRIGRELVVSAGGRTTGAASSSSTGSPGRRHTVTSGDSLGSISSRYGISVRDLKRWNGLTDGRIYATTRLLLFDPGSLPSVAPATSRHHEVGPGENLSSIAGRYGVSVRAIVEASGLADPNHIRVGQRLTIPGGSGGFPCPVPGATFFNDWGFPRSGGRAHAGNDLFAARGAPVYAPVDGFVEIATGAVGGKQFRLTAPDGSRWYGSHLSDFGATGKVRAGTRIGAIGDTGNALGGRPHLHIEYHAPGGHPVNPYPLLAAACR